MALDFKKLEKKWQKRWFDAKLGSAERSKKPKWFGIFAYITVSGYMHTGHMRGYSYSDFMARLKRLQGYNVLFPVGSHATGNGAIAKAQKIAEGDPKWVNELKEEGASASDIKKVATPEGFVDFFNKTYVEQWKQFGYLADYDRFITTITPDYNKFIEWQFKKLKQRGLLVQKPYFATACIKCGPVSVDPAEMDLLKGGKAEQQEFTILKFKLASGECLVAATLRPDTAFGQTNLWVRPDVTYEKIQVGKEVWIASSPFLEKISYQKENVKSVGKIKGSNLIGKEAIAPGPDRKIPILPSEFVTPDIGTGIVTSVPSDAVYDYAALLDLKADKKTLKKYNIEKQVEKVNPVAIINVKGYEKFPAVDIVERLNIKNQNDPRLEEATHESYKTEYHTGVLNENCGKYSGLKVSEAIDKIKQDFIKQGKADVLHDLSEEVICRCGNKVVIKKVASQWFIKYSDKKITADAKKCAEAMGIEPEDYCRNMPGVLDWFVERPCARQGRWMGTTLPFDKSYIIEAISDSTLYPIYYLVSKYVNNKSLNVNELTEEFFDYVFLGKGKPKKALYKKIRDDVEYWYPLDMNLGGKEHRTVHFPPFIKNHVALLPKKYWPKGIFTHEWIVGKAGEKFSKSKGNAELVPAISEKYGVDSMRLYYANIASPFSDVEFDADDVYNYKKKLSALFDFVLSMKTSEVKSEWIESRFAGHVAAAKAFFEANKFKEASDEIYFNIYNDFKWCQRRRFAISKSILKDWVVMMSAVTPHVAEELWEKLGGKGFVAEASLPQPGKTNKDVEKKEEQLKKTVDDVANIIKIVGKKIKNIYLYVIPPEINLYNGAEEFFSKEFGAKAKVFAVNDPKKYDPEGKASKAKPGKPGIYLE